MGDRRTEPEEEGHIASETAGTHRLESRRLERLIDAGRALVSILDLEAVLEYVLHTAREVTGARYAALGILDEPRESLERFVTLGIDDELRARIGDPPTGRGVLGELIRDARPLRIGDVGSHPASYGFPPGHPPMHSFLGVPIMIRGEAWGNLYLTEKDGGGEFDQADENSAVILADWAAIAIENARLIRDGTEPPRRVGGGHPAAARGNRDHARTRRRDRHRTRSSNWS